MMEKGDTEKAENSEIGNPVYCSYEGGQFIYKDPNNSNQFVWREEEKKWIPKTVMGGSSVVHYDPETHSYTYNDNDGTTFEWEPNKAAWFPKGKDQEVELSTRTDNENISPTNTTDIHPSTPPPPPSGFHNPNYDNSLQNNQQNTSETRNSRRFYYSQLSPTDMGVNEPVLFLSPDDQVNNNSTIPQEPQGFSLTNDASASTAANSTISNQQLGSSTSALATSLPTGWERHDDANGPYYWHIKSGTIQRDPPTQQSIATSNPALLIPGSLQSSVTPFRRSQTISSQLSSVIPTNNSNNSTGHSTSSNTSNVSEKRKSWSQYLENSEHSHSFSSHSHVPLAQQGENDKDDKPLRFIAVSLGCLSISEEDLTPERSSRAVSKVIAELTNPNSKIGSSGLEVAGKIWGGRGTELFLELDDSHLRVKVKDRILTVLEQQIHSIRVWGVGREDPRDFAFVAREKQTRIFLCHVFRLEIYARPLANSLRDACKKIMIERQAKQKRPNTLPTGLRKPSSTSNSQHAAFFPTPMDEPRKLIKAYYMGSKVVCKPTGMDELNAAIETLNGKEPIPVQVSVAPSVIKITSEESDTPNIDLEVRVRFLSFLGIGSLDEEFLARYNINYGTPYVPPPPKEEKPTEKNPSSSNGEQNDTQNLGKRKLPPQPPQWFDVEETQNTKVYVSNLPTDLTEEEFLEFMGKCGLVMKDPTTGKYKIKLYEKNGCLKGDALCTYIKVDSVDLALQILDGSFIRSNQVKVELAKFTLKGEYDPTKKPKQKKRKEKEKLKKKQEALFAWKPEKLRGERPKSEKVVVVKNAFAPEEFNNNVELILELKEDIREEALKLGNCRRVEIYDAHPEGVVQIFMSGHEEADAVVANFNGRFFGGKRLTAELYDGVTQFKVNETDAERDKRLAQWEKFISEDDPPNAAEEDYFGSVETGGDPEAVTPPRDS